MVKISIFNKSSVLATPMSVRRNYKSCERVATIRRDLLQAVCPTEPSGLRSEPMETSIVFKKVDCGRFFKNRTFPCRARAEEEHKNSQARADKIRPRIAKKGKNVIFTNPQISAIWGRRAAIFGAGRRSTSRLVHWRKPLPRSAPTAPNRPLQSFPFGPN
jgi:hypothetical protein